MSKKPSTLTTGTPNKAPARRHAYTYWITRDRGASLYRVWTARPHRDDNGIWSGELYSEWDLQTCLWWARVTPDDDRQCIRVEGDSVKSPTDLIDAAS